ncbi:MAG: hypothetical protein OXQ94_13085 [Gemmatimonadota bacterium]|nr:hypothetical protein [Gemmatimonadota bacterium]
MIHLPFLPSAPFTGAHPRRARGALRLAPRLAVALAVVGLGGCGIFGLTTERRVIGIMGRLPEIPETATAGVPFEMTIWTQGDHCNYIGGETDVAVTGPIAEVTPFDYVTGSSGCILLPAYFEHKATVVFQEPGTAAIVLVTAKGIRPQGGIHRTDDWHKEVKRKLYTVEVSPAG